MPAKMPAAHQAKLNTEIAKILNTKEFKDKLFQLGWQVEGTTKQALVDRINADTALYGKLIKAKGYKLLSLGYASKIMAGAAIQALKDAFD